MNSRSSTGKLASTSGRPLPAARQPSQHRRPFVQCSGEGVGPPDSEEQHVKRPRYRRPWERWWGGAPRVRVRKLDDRQREQLAELAILNERLAGNQSPAARRRIEWLKLRRKEWEQIYNYVTKRDAAVSLAMIEEANRQVAAALSESVRERQGISTLKRHLVTLQGRLAEAQERLHLSQVQVQENLERIKQYEQEAAVLAKSLGGSSLVCSADDRLTYAAAQISQSQASATPHSMQQAWYPVAFAHQLRPGGMIALDLFGQPWVMFRSADGRLSCIKDECAHRACPLSLGKIVDGEIQCPYHGWQYAKDGSCTVMPSTTFCPGIKVDSLSSQEHQGLFWVWPSSHVADAQPQHLPELSTPQTPGSGMLQAGVQADLELDSHVLYDWLLSRPPSLPHVPNARLQSRASHALASWMLSMLLREERPGWSADVESPITLTAHLTGAGPPSGRARQWHACLPTRKGHVRWLYRLEVAVPHVLAALPGAQQVLQWAACQMMLAELQLLEAPRTSQLARLLQPASPGGRTASGAA